MPVNANIPLSMHRMTVPDEQGAAVRAENILASRQNRKSLRDSGVRKDIQAKNSEMDAEQKASLSTMAHLHTVENGWYAKNKQSGMNDAEASRQAILKVEPYAQTLLDYHNKRYGTKYTIQDINQARPAMADIMTKYQEQIGIEKVKNSGRMDIAKLNSTATGSRNDKTISGRMDVAKLNAKGKIKPVQTTQGQMKQSDLIRIWKGNTGSSGTPNVQVFNNMNRGEMESYLASKPEGDATKSYYDWWASSKLNPNSSHGSTSGTKEQNAAQVEAAKHGLQIIGNM